MTRNISYTRLFPLFIVMLAITACVKSIDGIVEDSSTDRPFTPGGFGVRVSKDTATFSWAAPVLSAGKKYTYTVDISQDSTFASIDVTKTVDTLGFMILDPTVAVGIRYYARMRVNAFRGSAPSSYSYLGKPFSLPGQNFLRVIRDYEITPTTALIHWYANVAGLNKMVLTAQTNAVTNVTISASDNTAGLKLVTGLTPSTRYTLQLFSDTKSKGIMTFTTPKALVYTTMLSSGGDLAAAINNAADSAVIGLNPGTYTLGTGVFTITGKSVTVASVSGNPNDTKINVRELDLAGNKAGITLSGVEINGNYTGTSYGVQFLLMKGAPNQGDPTNFGNVLLDNCIIHDYTRCLVLANLATTASTHTFSSFNINNCIIYNIDKAGTSTYYNISLEKMLFNSLNITKSTFYNMGAGMINMGTQLAASTVLPTITIDYCTFNNFGGGNKYVLIDANANKVSYTLKNSILANAPQAGTVNASAYRGTGAGSVLDFLNNNYFQLNTAVGGSVPISLTGLNQVSCISSNLGWTPTTTNFSLAALPLTHPVLSISTSAGSVGDPRWVY